MYDIIENYLKEIIDDGWMKNEKMKLAMIGGIMINCDNPKSDRFLPLRFTVRTKTTTTNLFAETFGHSTDNAYHQNIIEGK